ncbi:IS3 family transposase [Parasediminibacterium sp. JCM 36343]|uniref:IS3 family transposase n=1 Tax=Parasediminibacterium sp. JCM 36343 TaxID=3374279 RepID=UPI00397E1028
MARNISKRDSQEEKKAYKIKWLYECFGLSKQAYYQKLKIQKVKEEQAVTIKKLIEPIRKKMPRYGTKKLHLDIQGQLRENKIKMGKDGFIAFCKDHQLLMPRTKRYFVTTDSNHHYRKSPNLVKTLAVTHSEQVWVTDITYINLEGRHAYLALVTDLYSKKVMGFCLDDNMRVGLVKEALEMAVKKRQTTHQTIIHHSDRGIQYCCPDYVEFAGKKGMVMSTTEKYDPYENAVAERINETLKYEFGLIKTIPDLATANKMLKEAVQIYNNERRHCSLGMQTPNYAHTRQEHKYKSYAKKARLTEGQHQEC